MKLFLLILACWTGLLSAPQSNIKVEPIDTIQWESIEGISNLSGADKKILVFIYTDWCKWCKEMEGNSFNDPQVSDFVNEHFTAVKFNGEINQEIAFKNKTYRLKKEDNKLFHELTSEFNRGNVSYPSLVFLDTELNTIQAINGYRNREDLIKILKYIEGEYYKKTSWNNYLRTYEAP